MTTKPFRLLTVLTNSVAGNDEEFNRWFDDVHLADVRAVPGIVSARRYRLASRQMRGVRDHPYEYLTIYEIDAEDPKAVADEIVARSVSGAIVISPTLDLDRSLIQLFEPIHDEQSHGNTEQAHLKNPSDTPQEPE